ncbi:hypothetical protein ACWD69_21670 [Micromonospora chokoriensis]
MSGRVFKVQLARQDGGMDDPLHIGEVVPSCGDDTATSPTWS